MFYNQFLQVSQDLKTHLEIELKQLQQRTQKSTKEGRFLTLEDKENLSELESKHKALNDSLKILKSKKGEFLQSIAYIPMEKVSFKAPIKFKDDFTFDLQNSHPFLKSIVVNVSSQQLRLKLHPEVESVLKKNKALNEIQTVEREAIQRMLMQDMARVSQMTGEKINSDNAFHYSINLRNLANSHSFVAFDLTALII